MNRRIVAVGAALAAAVLASCSSGGSDSSSEVSPSSQASTPATPTAMLAKLKAGGLPIGSTYKVTASNDKNHLLGRPNGYAAKSSFTDKRIKRDEVRDIGRGSVELGGSIEQFTDSGAAKKRADYISSILKNAPILGTEYDYVVGNLLIRVSGVLTPKQAAAYKVAATK